MRVIVFRSRLREGVLAEYGPRVEEIADLAHRMPGFVASKDFTAEDGERVAVIEFRSAIARCAAGRPAVRWWAGRRSTRTTSSGSLVARSISPPPRRPSDRSAGIAVPR